MPVDIEKLQEQSSNLGQFLEFEREIEDSIRHEETERRREIEDEKRAREKKARRKRLKKMRQAQNQ
jgi:hypothetical protein